MHVLNMKGITWHQDNYRQRLVNAKDSVVLEMITREHYDIAPKSRDKTAVSHYDVLKPIHLTL